MSSILLQEDINEIETRLGQFESNTGCELLLVVAKSSDPYPAASLRFGLIAGLIASLIFIIFFEFTHHSLYPLSFFLITLIMVWVGHYDYFKSLALAKNEINRETSEKAMENFYSLGTSKVSHKVTAMIMVSQLEHKIHVLIDETLKTKINQEELNELIQLIQTHFKSGNMGLGFIEAIEKLEKKILGSFGGRVSEHHMSELANQIIFQ